MTITSGAAFTPPPDTLAHDALALVGDTDPQLGVVGAPTTEPSDGISVVVAPSPTAVPSGTVTVAAADTGTAPEAAHPTTNARVRAALPVTGPGLTGLGGVVLGTLVVGLGTLIDVALGSELGLGFTATFLLGCVLVAVALRVRALATAVVLPPLLFASAAFGETKHSGVTSGNRQAALDVATTLALSAPALFVGTTLALAIVLGRLVVHAVRR